MPCVLSMCHGGISRCATRCLIERAQGLASSYVMSDIGATVAGRWHTWQWRWKIGATSLLNVTGALTSAARAKAGTATMQRDTKAAAMLFMRVISLISRLLDPVP